MKYYLAIDIGASGGRHILGHVEQEKLICEEVHRFPNAMVQKNGKLCWDVEALFAEVLRGMKRCGELGKIPASVGIDTWGVDFVLLDAQGNITGDTAAYRDSRTENMMEEVFRLIPKEEVYGRTGISLLPINTIFQLMALKKSGGFDKAKTLLLMPDYLHYRLCGIAKTEYTNATTTCLINAHRRTWDEELIQKCGYPREIFQELIPPGTVLGGILPEIREQIGFYTQVAVPATHDTASAVMAVPAAGENTLYISSGTWSLMGVERSAPDCSTGSLARNFTNEGGYDYRYRYLKNIMGLWMIQSVKKELGDVHSYDELCALAQAAEEKAAPSLVDCNNGRFFSPKSMIQEIKQACAESAQPVSESPGELAAVIYNSLALCYKNTVKELEYMTGQSYPAIHIVGGGAKAGYLNALTARYTGKAVYAGPAEATAIGNLLAQMLAGGLFPNLQTARKCVKTSFEIESERGVQP